MKLSHLPSNIEVQAFWAHMKAHQLLHLDKRDKGHPVKNDLIRIEISPERDDSKDWTLTQWREVLEQFVRAFDSADKSDPRFRNHKCNLANSQYLATLHRDSKSGILHMHLDCNRIDMDGELNDDYLIGSRAVFAANQVTRERGWIQAEQRAAENRAQISNDCYAILLVCAGCGPSAPAEGSPSDGGNNSAGGEKLSIVATVFPEYDWIRSVLGQRAEDVDLTLLLDTGVDLHSYQPTAEDIVKLSRCDVFIYIGGESDEWVDDMLKNVKNKDMRIINLMETLSSERK